MSPPRKIKMSRFGRKVRRGLDVQRISFKMSADERERSLSVRQHVKGGLGRREASERMEIGVSPV
jgi:hypothetical protein